MTHRKEKKSEIWFCPHCERPFFTNGVSVTLTTRCPHCKRVQNIRELHYAGRRLIYAGLLQWSRMLSLTDDLDPYDADDATFVGVFSALRMIAFEVINKLARDTEVLMYAENHSDYVLEEREQEAYFKKNPESKYSRGEAYPA